MLVSHVELLAKTAHMRPHGTVLKDTQLADPHRIGTVLLHVLTLYRCPSRRPMKKRHPCAYVKSVIISL